MNRKLNEIQAREILTRAHAGEPQNLLAREFRVTEAAVSRLLTGRTWKLLPRAAQTKPKPRGRKLGVQEATEIQNLRQTGTSRNVLAERFGVTAQTIANIERKKAWEPPQQPQQLPTPHNPATSPKQVRRRVWED